MGRAGACADPAARGAPFELGATRAQKRSPGGMTRCSACTMLRGMKRELVPDRLWERVAPLLPRDRRRRRTRRGRPRRDDRACLRGIIFVLKTGIAWRDLPADVFGCSGVTCWRRLRSWTHAGVFARLQRVLLDDLGLHGDIDWSRVAFDSASVRALKGGPILGGTLQIAGRKARSTTSSSIAQAIPSPRSSPPRTSTTRTRRSHSSTPSPP